MRYRGVIFDLDGTLADTLADIASSMNRVLLKNGYPAHSVPDYKYMIGRGLENLVTSSLPAENRSPSVIHSCLDALLEDYRRNCLVNTRLYEGIEDLLARLQKEGVKMGVFSNKADELTRTIVHSLLPRIKFEMILGARPDQPGKPDPAGAIRISQKMGIKPENIVFIGDSDVDMIMAVKAGMLAVGALWGFRTGRELRDNGASMLLKNPGQLLEFDGWEFNTRS
jgi:phosphoglycolate phosphatase